MVVVGTLLCTVLTFIHLGILWETCGPQPLAGLRSLDFCNRKQIADVRSSGHHIISKSTHGATPAGKLLVGIASTIDAPNATVPSRET
jgi:hypothetical protein